MSNDLTIHPAPRFEGLTPDQFALLKRTICRGATNDEFALFWEFAKNAGLDPFRRQIHAVRRKQRNPDGSYSESMSIQTGIDGYRLIAARSGRYAPGKDVVYGPDISGHPAWARATVKLLAGGAWHEVEATAYWSEYAAMYRNKQGEMVLTAMWERMPHLMLGKCAEALALRKAFPDELSGLYTDDEMAQAENDGGSGKTVITNDEVIDVGRVESEAVGDGLARVQTEQRSVAEAKAGDAPDVSGRQPTPKPSECITDKQRKLLFALLWKGANKEDKSRLKEDMQRLMFDVCGTEHTEQIAKSDFNALLLRLPDINPACGERVKELLEKGGAT